MKAFLIPLCVEMRKLASRLVGSDWITASCTLCDQKGTTDAP